MEKITNMMIRHRHENEENLPLEHAGFFNMIIGIFVVNPVWNMEAITNMMIQHRHVNEENLLLEHAGFTVPRT